MREPYSTKRVYNEETEEWDEVCAQCEGYREMLLAAVEKICKLGFQHEGTEEMRRAKDRRDSIQEMINYHSRQCHVEAEDSGV